MNNHDLPKHYEIEGVLYPASEWANWAAVDGSGDLYQYMYEPIIDIDNRNFISRLACEYIGVVKLSTPEIWRNSLTPATTELDRYCLKMYGSMFDKIDTNTQSALLFLYEKGGLKL